MEEVVKLIPIDHKNVKQEILVNDQKENRENLNQLNAQELKKV
jgi:hypothetical protein